MGFSSATWTTADFQAVLKEYYLPPAQDILHNKTLLLKRIEQDTEHIEGQYAVAPLRIGRNEGHGFIGKGGKLPQPKQQKYSESRWTVKLFYGRVMLPGPDMAEAQSDLGSFVRLMDSEMSMLPVDMAKTLNTYLFGDGSGYLARISAIAGTTITLTANLGLGYTNTSNPTKWLRKGMVVVPVLAGAATGTARTITAINASANQITIDSAFGGTAAANDYLVIASEPGVTPADIDHGYNNVPMGIRGIFDTVNPPTKPAGLQNLDVATEDYWVAQVLDNSGTLRPLTLDLLQQAQDQLEQVADQSGTLWLTDHAQRRAYLNLLEAAKRYVNEMTLDGGFRALSYNDVPFVVDSDAPGGLIWHYDESKLKFFTMRDYHWLTDGSILSRDADRDMFQAALASYFDLGTMNRRAGAVLEDLSNP